MRKILWVLLIPLLLSCGKNQGNTPMDPSEFNHRLAFEEATAKLLDQKPDEAIKLLKSIPGDSIYNKQAENLHQIIDKNRLIDLSLQKENKLARKGWQLGKILVAAKPIPAGGILKSEHMKTGYMPMKYITEGMLKPDNRGFVIGQPMLTRVEQGDPIFYYTIQVAESPVNLSKLAKSGGRIVTISSRNEGMFTGIHPHDHIDIISVTTDATGSKVARTILKDVIVIATCGHTSQTITAEIQKNRVQNISCNELSLYLLPEEAKLLTLAERSGTLLFSLRNEDDQKPVTVGKPVLPDHLLSGEKRDQYHQKRKKTIQRVMIIRGGY